MNSNRVWSRPALRVGTSATTPRLLFVLLLLAALSMTCAFSVSAAAEPAAGAVESVPAETQKKLGALVIRLTETSALGLFGKLSLKGDLDKFLAAAKNFHGGKGGASLAELEADYSLLVTKLVAAVQKKDPELARDISAFRDELWLVVADAEAFFVL